MTQAGRGKVLITGAAGGMGRTCARLFGGTHDLVLTDASPALDGFAETLRDEGLVVVAARSGDLADDALIAALIDDLASALPLTIVHTAGLSPALGDWRQIMTVNLVATVKLLDALETVLVPGSVAVLIASTAGHMLPPIPEVAALTSRPLAPDFLDAMTVVIDGMAAAMPGGPAGIGYMLSKQAVLSIVENRSIAWGAKGARIVSISPGMILTPMGRKEIAETDGAAQLADATPAGRSGAAIDIALAVRFLASPDASFITGCDLRVDGGGTAAVRASMAQA